MGKRDVEVESTTTGSADADETREVDAERVVRASRLDALMCRPGDQIDRYVILRELGSGGMSVVYVAYDPELDRHIALKLVRPGGAIAAAESAPRLQREAQALARLSHPNVVHVYDVGTFDKHVFIAMELVDGKTMRQWIVDEQPSWKQVLEVLLEAGEGLAAAHDAGLVHFDFKPSNVLIGTEAGGQARVRVVDFGLAREPRSTTPGTPLDSSPPSSSESLRSGRLSEQLTEHGAVMGTPGFMSPEHLTGKEADARADQYSFCVTLWLGLYGERPFVGHNRAALQKAVLRGNITLPAHDRGVPGWIQAVLRRGMSVSPADRYPTLRALLGALRRDPATPRRRIALAAVSGLAAAGLVYFVVQSGRPEHIDCEAGRDRVAASWDERTREAGRAAFAGTELQYADDAWRRTADRLDDYATQWGEMHVDACEATHVRGEQSAELLDRRMACLQRARLKFAALVDLFAAADADVVRNAVSATQSLAPISRCADAAALEPETPLPDDPAQRERVEALEQEIARVDAMQEAGRYAEAETDARRLVEEAQALGHAPLLWSAANLLGDVYTARGNAEKSLEAHGLALASADAAGLDFARAESMREHSFVYGNLMGNTERAEWFSRSAHAVLDRVGAGPELRADLLSNEAVIVTIAGRIEEGLALNRRAVELRREAGLADDTRYALLLGNLGGALYSAGRYEEALEAYRDGLRIEVEQLGERHPGLGIAYENVGNALQALERYDEALDYHRAALELSKTYAMGGPKLALQHSNIGVALFGIGRYDDAREHYQAAIATWKASSPAHPGHGVALCNLGELELRVGRIDDARASYEEGLRLLEAAVHEKHPWLAVGLTGLAIVLLEQGEHGRAFELARHAHEIHELTPTDAFAAAETELHYGRALWEVDASRRADARAHVEAARAALANLGQRAELAHELAGAWLRAHA
jgi:tetratricopeptide (TPR) repeat protein